MNFNKVIVAGRVTRQPELKSTQSGQSVTSFGLACNRTWTDKSGQKQEQVEFINCVFWGKTAEAIAKYVEKGQVLLVEGRLQTRKWQDKDGSPKQTTEVMGESFQFGERSKKAQGEGRTDESVADELKAEEDLPTLDELPF